MDKQQEEYLLRLCFPDFSTDNVLSMTRTLCKKPVVPNGFRLQHPSNEVYHFE